MSLSGSYKNILVMQMVQTKAQTTIEKRLGYLEQVLTTRLNTIEDKLEHAPAVLGFLNGVLTNYEQQFMGVRLQGIREREQWLRRIYDDQGLRHPHQKILNFLANQYDYQVQQFRPVHFSKLVREAHIGKNVAREYLTYLEEKGYVVRRSNGNRVYYGLVQQDI